MIKKYGGRIYDPNTCTYAYEDGSGFLTEEQVILLRGKKHLISNILMRDYFYSINNKHETAKA